MAEAEAWVMIPKLDEKKTGCILEMKPLVLCKDCEYWRTNTEFCMRWSVANVAHHTPPNWFCADGKAVKRE